MPRSKELIVALLANHAHFITAERTEVVVNVLLQFEEPSCSQGRPAGRVVLILYQVLCYFLVQFFATRFCTILILNCIFKLLFTIVDIRLMYSEIHLQLYEVHQVLVLWLLSSQETVLQK